MACAHHVARADERATNRGAWDRGREQTMMQAPVNRLEAGQDMTERDNEAAYQRLKITESNRFAPKCR
jgi:hypothetical protein